MHLKPLLGLQMKDPKIVEILDVFEADVIYSFDRDFEGQPDRYYAAAHSGGLEFQFDEHQRLATIFVYITGNDTFSAFDLRESELQTFENPDQAKEFFENRGLNYKENRVNPNMPKWVRVDQSECSVHYQFGRSGLSMITLMRPDSVPGAA